MAWFSPIKGAYPGLAQIDKTLPVAAGETGIVRGSLIYEDGGKFKLGTATQASSATAVAYWALMGQDDFQAGMAGGVGYSGDNSSVSPVAPGADTVGHARITGLSVTNPGEFQTDQYDKHAESWTLGEYLTFGAAGTLTPWTSGNCVVAQLTAVPSQRYINDLALPGGRMTGGMAYVINFRTVWIPKLTA